MVGWGTRDCGAAMGADPGSAETYQIGQQTRAHEGSIFALCRRRDGTVLSGGGKDRRVVCWSPALVLLQVAVVGDPAPPPPKKPSLVPQNLPQLPKTHSGPQNLPWSPSSLSASGQG